MASYRDAIAVSVEATRFAPDEFKQSTYKVVLEDQLTDGGRRRQEPRPSTATPLQKPAPAGDQLAAIAGAYGIDRDDATLLYDIDGDAVRLGFEPSRLDRTKAAGTEQVFFLLCAARQLALGAQETPMDMVKAACSDFGRLDSTNFASTINKLAGLVVFGGTPRLRTYRLTRAGLERAKAVAAEILGKVKAEKP